MYILSQKKKKAQLLCSRKVNSKYNKGHGVKCSVVKFTKPTVYVVEITEMKKINNKGLCC